MFLGNMTTLFENIQRNEQLNYYNSIHNQVVSIDTDVHENKIINGSVLFKVDLDSPFINSLMFHQGFTNTKDRASVRYVSDLFNNVTNQLLQIKECYSLQDCLKIIANFVDKAGNNFYGALLKNSRDGTLMNPLHPLVAPVILGNFDMLNKSQWYPILYFYSDRRAADNLYKTSDADAEIMKTQIDCIYNAVTSTVAVSQRKAITKVVETDNIAATVETLEALTIAEYSRVLNGRSLQASSMLVAHQMMTEGITAPYYGTTLLSYEPGSRALGGHVSPMRSCNISYEGNEQSATRTRELRYIKVCTGSKSSGTLEGIRTLMHANLSSPYTRHIIMDGALAYADICVNKALQIFKLANIIDMEVSVKEVTQEESSLVTPEMLDRYVNDRINLLQELYSKCTKEEFLEILKAIKAKIIQ